MQLDGVHHLTAVSADARGNHDFSTYGRFGKIPGDGKEFIPLPERVTVRSGSHPSAPGRISEGLPAS